MSFRPTIAVYIGGRIADIMYCRNWYEEHLLYEAAAIAVRYDGCRTKEEYLLRRYGTEHISYSVYPEVFSNSEEDLKALESCSELPVVVDLTARQIYTSYGALSEAQLAAVPSAADAADEYGCPIRWSVHSDFYRLLSDYRIPFDQMDADAVLALTQREPA